jgi:hypothetical protein
VTLTAARRYVTEHHSHNAAPIGWLFGVGVENGHGLAGVAMAGRPVARMLQDGETVEITRVCTDGTKHACSMLYGAIWRAALALGYRKAITYTLEREAGVALKATGWTCDGPTQPGGQSWWRAKRPGDEAVDLFGQTQRPQDPKVRWSKSVTVEPLGLGRADDERPQEQPA